MVKPAWTNAGEGPEKRPDTEADWTVRYKILLGRAPDRLRQLVESSSQSRRAARRAVREPRPVLLCSVFTAA
ncbi:hypothetical protein AK812_SmicGene26193 [Symbiodinium microadriaticum]|uniref:Uncharacterized protein n=1 Tax=Symbiodinium microadriaticum TaxID=2951 RepID=A0A1Q9DA76_SYMMI|nr:hypothetical protein AK812_SmicGene26193 [Symbiodinium microadriaticum]